MMKEKEEKLFWLLLRSFFLGAVQQPRLLFLRQLCPQGQAVQGADDVALLQQRSSGVAHGGVPYGIAQGVCFGVEQLLGAAGVLEMQVAQQPTRPPCCAGRHGFHGQQAAEGPVFRHIFRHKQSVFLAFQTFFQHAFQMIHRLAQTCAIFVQPLDARFLPYRQSDVPTADFPRSRST